MHTIVEKVYAIEEEIELCGDPGERVGLVWKASELIDYAKRLTSITNAELMLLDEADERLSSEYVSACQGRWK